MTMAGHQLYNTQANKSSSGKVA